MTKEEIQMICNEWHNGDVSKLCKHLMEEQEKANKEKNLVLFEKISKDLKIAESMLFEEFIKEVKDLNMKKTLEGFIEEIKAYTKEDRAIMFLRKNEDGSPSFYQEYISSIVVGEKSVKLSKSEIPYNELVDMKLTYFARTIPGQCS